MGLSEEEIENDTEESPKTTSDDKSEPTSTEVSPQNKRGRGRPKKILKDSDIVNALDQSYQNSENEDVSANSESESEESEDDEEEDELQKPKIDDENIRRSGRERKAPKKFEAILTNKKKRKKRYSSESDQNEEDEDSDYSSKKSKPKKLKKSKDKFGIYKKSPNKVKRKQTRKIVSDD